MPEQTMMKTSALLTLAAMLVACGATPNAPSDEAMAGADFGAPPANYEAIVRAYFDRLLKDPASAQYKQIAAPEKVWTGSRFDAPLYGYLVCASVNAKNSYGGYVGFKTTGLIIRDGSIARVLVDGRYGTRNMCPP